MPDHRPAAIFLMGPTASGKTALALDWAARLPCEIVSVDSALVYRGLDIGSAKPDRAIRSAVPHHLIDIREVTASYSAAEFRADALAAIQTIHGRGRVPLLVGGTSLYFRALQRGLSELPAADPPLRARIEAEAAALGWAALHQRLQGLDADAARRIHPNDPQRIGRALEVIELSGQSLSSLHGRREPQLPFRLLKLAVAPGDRARLHARIELRFRQMVAAGLLDEVRGLLQQPGVDAELPALRAVGYRQAALHLSGVLGAEDWIAQGISATRQLAKRQLTWLRAEADTFLRDPDDPGQRADLWRLIGGFV